MSPSLPSTSKATDKLYITHQKKKPHHVHYPQLALNLAHLNLINGDIYHLIFNLQNGYKQINHFD